MNGKRGKGCRMARIWLLNLGLIALASAFVRQPSLTIKPRQYYSRQTNEFSYSHDSFGMTLRKNYLPIVRFLAQNDDGDNIDVAIEFDDMLEESTNFAKAVRFLRSHPDDIKMSRDRFGRIFDAIEVRTSDAEEGGGASDQQQPVLSESRKEMTEMYTLLKEQGHLLLFGSITKENMPASGSHTVLPSMLETITSLSMSSLTPQPSNTMMYAGVAAALGEAGASEFFGWNLNVMFFVSLTAALFDQIILNGTIGETFVKILSPETQSKITRHEAGHFLCSYILGCPVEGYVLSSLGALRDPRFRGRGVSAGTSFFDPILSHQIEKSKISRSSIDRYSIIVMAGIAAEATIYGKADGGAGDEQALIGFLSNLNGGSTSSAPAWNNLTIRNQARWGALQSVLILREYKECYDALVDALEQNGSLGDCIYAIENAARQHNKEPLRIPLGYISEEGGNEIWTKVTPDDVGSNTVMAANDGEISESLTKKDSMSPDESLEALRALKETITSKIKGIDGKLEGL